MKYDMNNDYTLDFNEVSEHLYNNSHANEILLQLRTAVAQMLNYGVISKQELLVKMYTVLLLNHLSVAQ